MSLNRLIAVRLPGPLQCREEGCDWENIAFWEEKEKEGTKQPIGWFGLKDLMYEK